jgi:Vesicle transport v-SNARE protein N-terminus
LYDLTDVGVGSAFIDDASARLTPGKAALVAEIQEEWITPLDSRMEALGGTVLRRTWSDVVDAQIARDVAAIDADIDAMEAEYEQATEAEKAKLQARIADAKAELNKVQQRASARIEAADREAEEKLAALDKQVATADAERKRKLEQRKLEVQEDYKRRSAKLEEASELSKQAARLTREAVTP